MYSCEKKFPVCCIKQWKYMLDWSFYVLLQSPMIFNFTKIMCYLNNIQAVFSKQKEFFRNKDSFRYCLCVNQSTEKHMSQVASITSPWVVNNLLLQNVVAPLFWQVDVLAVSLQTLGLFLVGRLYSVKIWGLWPFQSDSEGMSSCIPLI